MMEHPHWASISFLSKAAPFLPFTCTTHPLWKNHFMYVLCCKPVISTLIPSFHFNLHVELGRLYPRFEIYCIYRGCLVLPKGSSTFCPSDLLHTKYYITWSKGAEQQTQTSQHLMMKSGFYLGNIKTLASNPSPDLSLKILSMQLVSKCLAWNHVSNGCYNQTYSLSCIILPSSCILSEVWCFDGSGEQLLSSSLAPSSVSEYSYKVVFCRGCSHEVWPPGDSSVYEFEKCLSLYCLGHSRKFCWYSFIYSLFFISLLYYCDVEFVKAVVNSLSTGAATV